MNTNLADHHHSFTGSAYFPLAFYEDFLGFLNDNRERIDVLTYNDLPWGDDYCPVTSYPDEYQSWKTELALGKRDMKKAYVLIQHDIDRRVDRMQKTLELEKKYGIPSNVMIFHRRVNQRHYRQTSVLQYDPEYKIDYKFLKHLQNEHGFVIGYHSNAYGQAEFDQEKALEIFESDVRELRKTFNIKFFSPHGGLRDPDGKSNNSLPIPPGLERDIRWVANTRTFRTGGRYSDGGINSPKRDPRKRDLRDFVRTWKPGNRYHIITHPQYYDVSYSPSPRLQGTQWYDELLEFYKSQEENKTAWDDVTIEHPVRSNVVFSLYNKVHSRIWRLLNRE